MKIEIQNRLTGKVIFSCEAGSMKLAVEMAVAASADLSYANLRSADLRYANLSYANLSYANLRCADLRYANLSYADLRYADLRYANLHYADLRYANLSYANLRYADLRYADLDYSCWPLWCGSKKVKVDAKIAAQLAAHFCAVDCEDKEYQKARKAILKFAQASRRGPAQGFPGRSF